ncbi:MAG: hypothetical protein MJZ28_11620 [Paludibacteraceae bacterium]|nr:hypothetical protein [Paludibacteraceae bacterium]
MKRIIKFTAVILLTSFCLQSCDPFESEEGLETIRLGGVRFHNSCNFEATYNPYSVDDSYRDNIHTVGQHVICSIGDKLYEVEFLETGSRSSHFYGSFHILKEEGVEVSHEEDGVVWYHKGLSGLLISYLRTDTTFSVTYYEKSNLYGDNSVVIPKEVVNRAIESTKRTAFTLDSLRQIHIDNSVYLPYPQIRVEEQAIVDFSYNEEDGLYYRIVNNNQHFPLLPDKEIIVKKRMSPYW